jgi:membrane protein DedA with SNARE-associated domain
MFEWITSFIEKTGYLGIALLMFAENLFPPIPSEVIMPLAGFTAARGDLQIVLAVLAGVAGSVAGTSLWYLLGRWIGMDRMKSFAARHGRWLTLTPQDLDSAQTFFSRHCGKAVFLGRLIPGVRTLISVPAGVVEMGFSRFLLYSTSGTVLWTALLAGAGYVLEARYRMVTEWLDPITNGILAIAALWYVYRVVTFRSKSG